MNEWRMITETNQYDDRQREPLVERTVYIEKYLLQSRGFFAFSFNGRNNLVNLLKSKCVTDTIIQTG